MRETAHLCEVREALLHGGLHHVHECGGKVPGAVEFRGGDALRLGFEAVVHALDEGHVAVLQLHALQLGEGWQGGGGLGPEGELFSQAHEGGHGGLRGVAVLHGGEGVEHLGEDGDTGADVGFLAGECGLRPARGGCGGSGCRRCGGGGILRGGGAEEEGQGYGGGGLHFSSMRVI